MTDRVENESLHDEQVLVDDWRERARDIDPHEMKSEEYWKGVKAAYHELADELERFKNGE